MGDQGKQWWHDRGKQWWHDHRGKQWWHDQGKQWWHDHRGKQWWHDHRGKVTEKRSSAWPTRPAPVVKLKMEARRRPQVAGEQVAMVIVCIILEYLVQEDKSSAETG